MAAVMLMLINFNNDCGIIGKIYKHYSHFLAATFDFPTFFTQAFKAEPLFHSLAVFEHNYI